MAREFYLLSLTWMVVVCCITEGSLQWQPQEPQGLPIVQYVQGHPKTPIGSVSAVEAKSTRQEQGSLDPYGNFTDKTKVKLPSLPCLANNECLQWSDPFLICQAGQCTCKPPYCWVYHLESTGWTSRYVFSCGSCGTLGSSCNASVICDYPGVCLDDGYCHCSQGENYNNICVVTDNSWMYIIAVGGLGIIFLFAIAMVLYNLYKNPPWRRQEPWCFGLCNADSGPKRRRSVEKSPAFTLQSMYTSQSEEIQLATSALASAAAEPRQRQDQNRRVLSDSAISREEVESVSSAATQVTVLSSRSITSDGSLANCVAAGGTKSNVEGRGKRQDNHSAESEGQVSMRAEGLLSLKSEDQVSLRSVEQGSEKSEEQVSITSLSSNCSHERCDLCLPKGLSARSHNASSSRASSPLTETTPRHSPSSRRSNVALSNDVKASVYENTYL
ncbi:uncharacterized protein LOC122266696 [Penaeus japonicus]|uniref:uncharacterized protein LOC122266696 n=1 Tax=Penaeus japonicus TaxID=27405 RepID=UPI001C70B9DB|nr:uncharacterized protein LOC122266696 [Penaeus japonicus]